MARAESLELRRPRLMGLAQTPAVVRAPAGWVTLAATAGRQGRRVACGQQRAAGPREENRDERRNCAHLLGCQDNSGEDLVAERRF